MLSKRKLCVSIFLLVNNIINLSFALKRINLEEVTDENLIYYETGNYSYVDDDIIFKAKDTFPGDVISFENSKFPKIPRNFFDVFPNVVSIEMRDCGVKVLRRSDFRDGGNLKRLNLRQNEIQSLPNEVFVFLRNLEYLDLEENQINELNPNTFNGLENLKHLDLSENSIKTLSPNVFRPLINLQHIDLELCGLQVIPDEIFSNNLKLENISLSNNQINQLGRNVFTNLNHLDSLAVDANSFDELYTPSLDSLFVYNSNLKVCYIDGTVKNFYAMGNQLRTVSISDVTKLEKFFVSNNLISNITNLMLAEDLVDLDISNNPIDPSTLTPELFSHMRKLEFLDLSGMNLTELNDHRIFSKLDNLSVLYLTSNNFVNLDIRLFTSMKKLTKLVISDNKYLTNFDMQGLRDGGFRGDVYGWNEPININ